ncbi:MAG: sensor histidine kinase N-terminal domain-containing protein [Burkholderiales bacterium]|nr:sensor histidine kinase N-terminal domain-containing protein [Burkholderiales bacterium]
MKPSRSLRRTLLLGILLPVLVVVGINTYSLYEQALEAVTTAYDRSLLASAKSIGEELEVDGYDDKAVLRATVPYAALEAFEADNQSKMFYRVSSLDGQLVSGYTVLPFWHGSIPQRPPYAALVDFYNDRVGEEPVRVAVLLQPVATQTGRGMAVIQVGETLELRHTLARQILIDTLWRQAALILVIAVLVVAVVQHATGPVRQLSRTLQDRPEGDLTRLAAPDAPRELSPLLDATNQVMDRLQHLLDHQKRFVRDAAHQLRTPLAVLKTQVQSALRSDVEPLQALHEINATVDRATTLANQMLALAKVEQLRQQDDAQPLDWAEAVRAVALDLSPLVADKDLDFALDTQPALVRAHDWMLRELTRNLLHNAIKYSPSGGTLEVQLSLEGRHAQLRIADSGPGISPELARRLYQPFSAGDVHHGSGMGLSICQEIVHALGGTISLQNRSRQGQHDGLDACVRLPLTT